METRIWFNRWFSTVYHYIGLIRNNEDHKKFKIYGTHPNRNAVYLQICDYAEQEPVLEIPAYIDYCLEFCKKHKIEVFVPFYRAVEISLHLDKFLAIGTKVLVPANDAVMETVSDKGSLFKSCEINKFAELPDYRVVNNAGDFALAYKDLINAGHRVCFKPVNGVGGSGFRIISPRSTTIEDLYGLSSHKLTFDDAYRILSTKDTFNELMVMEFLEGYEYSIDCLAFDGELLAAVPRKKDDGRIRILENNKELIEVAEKFNYNYKIPYVYNIQVKYSKEKAKLLEVNVRMSGGLHISCLSGINFPYLAIKMLLTEKTVGKLIPKLDIKATHIEQPLIMN